MKKWILLSIVIIAVALIPFTVSSCGVSKPQKPEIREFSIKWGEVTAATTEVLGTIMVYNPNSVTLPIKRITCNIDMDGIAIGQAETIDLELGKNAVFPVNISAKIDNTKIPQFWAEHIRRTETSEISIGTHTTFDLGFMDFTIPYTIKKPITTDLLSYLAKVNPVTVEKKIDVPLLGEKTVFKISMDSLSGKWGPTTSETTKIVLSVKIHNDNLYPLLTPKLRCVVESNGLSLGSGETGSINTFLPKSDNNVEVVATLNTGLMDDWFVLHIQQGEKSTFNIKVFMVFEVPVEIHEFLNQNDLSFKLWEGSNQIETDILGNKK